MPHQNAKTAVLVEDQNPALLVWGVGDDREYKFILVADPAAAVCQGGALFYFRNIHRIDLDSTLEPYPRDVKMQAPDYFLDDGVYALEVDRLEESSKVSWDRATVLPEFQGTRHHMLSQEIAIVPQASF